MSSSTVVNAKDREAGLGPGSAHAITVPSNQLAERFAALSELFDPGTIRHLIHVGVARDWRCLEIGGGGGSIASWLSRRVGPNGRVVVTDINTEFLENLKQSNIEVLEHNIVTDPLPKEQFDFVHARVLLAHLPERQMILNRLVAALKPGGWFLDEEFDGVSLRAGPGQGPKEYVLKAIIAMERAMAKQGVDLRFGSSMHGRLRSLGLTNVSADAHEFVWTAGSVGAHFLRSHLTQFREAMIRDGYISAEEFEQDLERLGDPEFLTMSPTLWAAWGRRLADALAPNGRA